MNLTPSRAKRIETTLSRMFHPSLIHVVDDSARHAGHAGARPGGETHYTVVLVADAFQGQTRIERHRRVNAALADEFADGLHALSLTVRTPQEHAALGRS